jgi:hypothetical protein
MPQEIVCAADPVQGLLMNDEADKKKPARGRQFLVMQQLALSGRVRRS